MFLQFLQKQLSVEMNFGSKGVLNWSVWNIALINEISTFIVTCKNLIHMNFYWIFILEQYKFWGIKFGSILKKRFGRFWKWYQHIKKEF